MVAMGFTKRVSLALVIEQLRDQCSTVHKAEDALRIARDERDDMMCELKAGGIPERTLCRITGLSLSTVKKITAGCTRSARALELETSMSPVTSRTQAYL